MTRERLTALAVKVYAALLRLYPPEFRHKYGEPMLQVFRDSCRDADGLARLWLAALADLLVNALAERAKQILTRRWLIKALYNTGAGALFTISSVVLIFTVMLITYFMLIPWDEGGAPTGTFAAAVNNFFENDMVLLPSFIVTLCEIIAITKVTRRRVYSAARIYLHFFALNTAVIVVGTVVGQVSMIVIGRVFPELAPFVPDPRYGTAAVYWGLMVVGAIIALFVRLAWRPPNLPMTKREQMPKIVM